MKWRMLLVLVVLSSNVVAQPAPQIAALLDGVSSDSLRKTIAEVTGAVSVIIKGQQDVISSRQYNTPGNEKAFSYLKDRLMSYGCTVDSQVFSSTGKNLLGHFNGSDTNSLIIIGAHYDNIGYPSGQGADDNASGIAAVLECARLCQQNGFEHRVVFAFWDEEEVGSVGSEAFVQLLYAGTKRLVGYINLDMIGWDGNDDSVAEIHTRYSGQSVAWAAKATDLNLEYAIGLQLQTVNPGIAATDVAPFWRTNQTAIGIGEDFDSDRYPYRHSPDDTLGNLNFLYLTKQTRLALATLLTFAAVHPMGISNATTNAASCVVIPNPFDSEIQVNLPELSEQVVLITITDAVGRVMHQATTKISKGFIRVNTMAWEDGIYTLTVAVEGHISGCFKIVHASK